MMLRESATVETAVEALRVAVIEAPNANNPPNGGTIRDSYLHEVDTLAVKLGNVFERTSVSDLLHTTHYWFIAGNPIASSFSPMFRAVDSAASSEIRALVDRLTNAHEQFTHLGKWLGHSQGIFVLPDTNILMHHQPVDRIDWNVELKNLGAVPVCPPRLVVPLAVVKELDRKKFEGGDTMRGRAQRAIKVLHDLRQGVDVDQPATVKAAGDSVVTLEIPRDDIGRTPMIDGDTELIEYGTFLRRASGRTIAIVTRDMNLKIRAERAGLRVVWLDEKYRKDQGAAAG